MKDKTINKVISKKINDWLSSIDDEELREVMKSKIMVTGGCITSMMLNEEVNDYDIYLLDKATVKRVAQYYSDKWNEANKDKKNRLGLSATSWVLDGQDIIDWKNHKKQLSSFAHNYKDIEYNPNMEWDSENHDWRGPSGMIMESDSERIKIIINSDGVAGDQEADNAEYNVPTYLEQVADADNISMEVLDEEKNKYRPVFLSENAVTLSHKIQVVLRFHGDAEEIHSNYDFIHTTNYWTFKTGVVTNTRAIRAIMDKELFYSGSKYPIASLIRTRKFIKRGWQINAGQYLKMAMQVSRLDLNNIYVLQSQLVGVDSIYFMSFIEKIKKDLAKGEEIDLTGDYVTTIIDRVFG